MTNFASMNAIPNRSISVVIPTYNEEGNIDKLIKELSETFLELQLSDYEIIFVDDGSVDGSLRKIKTHCEQNDKIRYISFSKNFGHQLALKAGLDHADKNAVLSMDADLQHPVELIPEMLSKWESGADVIYTKRIDKDLPWFKRISSKMFYRLVNSLSQVHLEEGIADFRLLDRRVVLALRDFKESNLFIRGIIPQLGFRQESIDYIPNPRFAGETKYSFSRMLRFALTGITSLSARPLYFSIYLGIFFAFLAFLYGIYALYIFAFSHEAVPGWTSIIASIMLIGGLQLIMIGIIGVYLGKVFAQSKQRPNYIIGEKNF